MSVIFYRQSSTGPGEFVFTTAQSMQIMHGITAMLNEAKRKMGLNVSHCYSLPVCVSVCILVCVCVYLYMCMCLYMRVCLCVYICVHLYIIV